MTLLELKQRIQETLGMDVISTISLVTMVNNCTAAIMSKEYREYVSASLTPTNDTYPYEFDLSGVSIKRLLSVHPVVDYYSKRAQRISLADVTWNENQQGVMRITNFSNVWCYIIKNNTLYLDINANLTEPTDISITIGYYKNLTKLSMALTDTELSTTSIPVREEFEDAYVFYGLAFYANRFKMRPEIVTEYNNTFKYFVEDMLTQLDMEDQYYEQDVAYVTEIL